MEHIKLLGVFFISVFLSNCSNSVESHINQLHSMHLKTQQNVYDHAYQKRHLIDHFPNYITDTTSTSHSFPPTCPPEFECVSQHGTFCLIHDIDTGEYIIPADILYETEYKNDNNIIINQLVFGKNVFPIEKTNMHFNLKYPIPYFERYNFRLGRDSLEQIIDGETRKRFIYKVPQDLKVYILAAEAGNFWNVNCDESRPESLKEWKNGYSKGIALSDQENLIAYWLIVW